MVLTKAKECDALLIKHADTISLLKQKVEEQFPDLKTKSELNDGTLVDELFYLRYVLSSKDDLSTLSLIEDSKTLNNIYYAVDFRNKDNIDVTTEDEMFLQSTVPLVKTGDLSNGFPLLFLTVKEVNFDTLSSNKALEKKLLNALLAKRSSLFNELDRKTRESGLIVKSVTVYDLNGLSYSSIFKLKEFFKIVQNQSKVFKKLFPQCSELTIFVNVSAAYLVKSFMTSSKQKVMTTKELLKTLNSSDVIPSTVGGSFCLSKAFPSDLKFKNDDFTNEEFGNEEFEEKEEVKVMKVMSGKNKKIELSDLEREMVNLKKNRLFSINVLKPKQTVELYFTNFKNKSANVLVLTRQSGVTSTKKVCLPIGFSRFPLTLATEGEILIVYLDSSKAAKYSTKQVALENAKLKRSAPKKLIRFGRKKMMKMTKGNEFVKTIEVLRQQNELKKQGLKSENKVLFRFEVNSNVICGSDRSLSEADLESLGFEDDIEEGNEGLVEFDALSLTSKDSICSNTEPSFISSAAQILTGGILW